MAIKEETSYEKGIKDRLGNIITFWYPTAPKVNGLCIIRDKLTDFAAWNRFVTNYHKLGKRAGYTQVFEYMMKTNDYRNLVEWGFNWEESTEGKDYWEILNNRVKEALDAEEKKGVDLKELSDPLRNNNENLFPSQKKEETRPRVSPARVTNNSYINPIYALLSGATSVCEFAETLYELAPNNKEKLINVNVPVTSTTIMNIVEKN